MVKKHLVRTTKKSKGKRKLTKSKRKSLRKKKMRGGALEPGSANISNASEYYGGDIQTKITELEGGREQAALNQMASQSGGYQCGNSNQIAGDPAPHLTAQLQTLECKTIVGAEYDISGGAKNKKRKHTKTSKKKRRKRRKKNTQKRKIVKKK